MFVCLGGGGLFIYYVNSCIFFADFSIKSFSQKIVFSNSSIFSTGRSYGGTVIFIRKSIKCTITNSDIECDRFNAMLVDFYNITVLISCFYMPCD